MIPFSLCSLSLNSFGYIWVQFVQSSSFEKLILFIYKLIVLNSFPAFRHLICSNTKLSLPMSSVDEHGDLGIAFKPEGFAN